MDVEPSLPEGTKLEEYLLSLVDAFVLRTFGVQVSDDTLKKLLPYLPVLYYLRYGTPSEDLLITNLYSHLFSTITYPLFYYMYTTDPHIPNTYHLRAVVEQGSKHYSNSESEFLAKHMTNIQDYINSLPNHLTLDTETYLKTIHENPTINRKQAIKESTTSGHFPTHTRSPLMNIKLLLKNTHDYILKVSEFESIQYANAIGMGANNKQTYITKRWLWSGKKNTRHRNMDGTTIPVNEPFHVLNERTGETSMLMFPRDYARDPTGANTINCGCNILYQTNKGSNTSWLNQINQTLF